MVWRHHSDHTPEVPNRLRGLQDSSWAETQQWKMRYDFIHTETASISIPIIILSLNNQRVVKGPQGIATTNQDKSMCSSNVS
mmetsp:Transcript_30815/g.73414  ORF Transcript_30815/g.73414 Transcript_30815/m.73414 type:complete len:82 (-) Transcript_30815:59-304(-)